MSQIDQAVAHLKEHSEDNISYVADLYGVDRSTLSRRFRGVTKSRSQKAICQQLLTPPEEQRLLKHINTLCKRGIPPTPSILRNLAYEITGNEPGKHWSSRFVHRHQNQLDSGYLERLDKQRFKADNKYSYELWFNLLQEKMIKYNIEPENTYNMDEKGFLIGWSTKQQRVFSKASRASNLSKGALQDGNREWITCLACICADGSAIAPALIFAGASGTLQESWIEEVQPTTSCYFAASPSGWTNDNIALAWMEKVFDPLTKPKAGRNKRLLVLDGHGSHMNMRFLEWCHNRGIIVACYPPHTTHRLQPLDVGLFAPLAVRYGQQLDRFISQSMGLSSIKKRDFFRLFEPAFKDAFTPANIASAFAKTGLYPLQPSVVLNGLKTPSNSRPATSGSSTASTAKKVKKKVRFMGHIQHQLKKLDIGAEKEVEVQEVTELLQSLAAANTLQRSQITGLQAAIYNEQRRHKRSRTLFETLRADSSGGGLIFSPAAIHKAQALQDKQEAEKQAAKDAKELARDLRAEEKQQQAIAKAQAVLDREIQQKSKELEKAAKKRRQTLTKEAAEASKQLQLDTQAAATSQKVPKPKKAPKKVAKPSQLPPQQAEEPDARTTRAGRVLKPSRAAIALRQLTID